MKFGYEDLEVWNKAVDFAVQSIEKVERIKWISESEYIFRNQWQRNRVGDYGPHKVAQKILMVFCDKIDDKHFTLSFQL